MPGKRASNQRSQVVTRFIRIPKPLEDGKARCAGCFRVVSVNPNGRLRAHQSPAGEPCAYRSSHAAPVHLDAIPDVVMPALPSNPGRAQRVRDKTPSRLDVGSECVDCGKWLPGERSLCGQCANTRTRNRR